MTEENVEVCDIFESELCQYYQTKTSCRYKESHNVKCVVDTLNDMIKIYQNTDTSEFKRSNEE